MLEILVIVIAGLALAKRRGTPRRRYRRYLRGAVEEDFQLGTLASKTLVAQVVGDTVTESTWLSSFVATWAMSEFTVASGDGPIVVGIAHSDYTATEIEEWVENSDSWNIASEVEKEISRRKIRRVGVFRAAAAGGLGAAVLNQGRPVRTKCNWMLNTGQTVDLWAYNTGGSALATTDPQITVSGHANLWPR